jgi:hypothetical protein
MSVNIRINACFQAWSLEFRDLSVRSFSTFASSSMRARRSGSSSPSQSLRSDKPED